jgi:hypothetical protein
MRGWMGREAFDIKASQSTNSVVGYVCPQVQGDPCVRILNDQQRTGRATIESIVVFLFVTLSAMFLDLPAEQRSYGLIGMLGGLSRKRFAQMER